MVWAENVCKRLNLNVFIAIQVSRKDLYLQLFAHVGAFAGHGMPKNIRGAATGLTRAVRRRRNDNLRRCRVSLSGETSQLYG